MDTDDRVTSEPLTAEERTALTACERLIENPDLTQGAALRAIRDGRLYREAYPTFDAYCRERWKWSKTHVNRLIEQAETLVNLAPIGVTALPESHARQLAGLRLPDGELDAAAQRVVWQMVRATAPTDATGRPVVTAAHVKSLASVAETLITANAIDDGTGEMVSWNSLSPERREAVLRHNLAEETYERQQRQAAHIQRNAKPFWGVIVTCADAIDEEHLAERLEAEGRTVQRASQRTSRRGAA